jgi:REP element-mobilizing transposase RayT
MHLLLNLRDDQKLPVVMHDLKGASSRAVHAAVPGLQLDMGTFSLWQKGYGSRIVSPVEVDAVRRYIRTQMDRPLRNG